MINEDIILNEEETPKEKHPLEEIEELIKSLEIRGTARVLPSDLLKIAKFQKLFFEATYQNLMMFQKNV
jgi:hypothetical protein